MKKGGLMSSNPKPRFMSPSSRFRDYLWDKLELLGVDLAGQACFLLGLATIAGFGVTVAIPTLYGETSSVGWAWQCFGCFLVAEIIVNWICIKTVDSTYNPIKHGTRPDSVPLGEDCSHSITNGIDVDDVKPESERTYAMRKDATEVPLTYDNEQEVSAISSSPNKKYPYFSWKPCPRCGRPRPPRAYHCPICDVCILKRDHHCFVTGVCVGASNLRHFAVLLFWSSVATTFAGLHSLAYFYWEILPHCSLVDLFLPLAMLRCMVFRLAVRHLLLIMVGWWCLGFFLWCLAFGRRIYLGVITGLTSWEQWEHVRLRDSRPLEQKLRAVFGNFWWLNFVVPVHFVFKPIDDTVNWPTVKSY